MLLNPDEIEKQLYTLKEVGETLQVSVETIRKYIRQNRLQSIKYGSHKQSRVRIPADSLKTFIQYGGYPPALDHTHIA